VKSTNKVLQTLLTKLVNENRINWDEHLSIVLCSYIITVATVALGSRPRQRGCKGAGQREARESHQRLLGVHESVRD